MTGDEKAAMLAKGLEDFNRNDIEAMLVYTHPDFEFHDLDLLPDSGVYHGHEGIRQWRRNVGEQFETFTLEIVGWEEIGDQLVVDHVARGTGRSGATVDLPFTVVWRFRDGLIDYHKGYGDRDRAFADARRA